jgi:hypothetical protein
VFSVEEKPRQLNLLNNQPRRHGASTSTQAQHAAHPYPMPYGFYPPPPNPFFSGFPNPMQWPGAGIPHPPGPEASSTAAPPRHIRGPRIHDWLQHCDRVPGREGEFFFGLAAKFDDQGYRTIDQLTNSRMTVENLSNWLAIGKGTADLIIQYAEEDMALVRNGNFSMQPQPADEEIDDGEDIY